MNLTGYRLSVMAAAAFFVIGCQRSSPPAASPPAETATETIHVRRLNETEAVLAQLHRKAWVFKHWGGDVTSDFTIYHRPKGTDQQERVIYRASGDDAIHARRALQQTSEPERGPKDDDAPAPTDRLQLREAQEKEGYLIVVVPVFPYGIGSGEITYKFNLGSGAGVTSTTAAETIYPKTVFSHSVVGSGSGSVKEPVELTLGETKVLVDSTVRFTSRGSKTPLREGEALRYVLQITALKDGRLPKRDRQAEAKPLPNDGI